MPPRDRDEYRRRMEARYADRREDPYYPTIMPIVTMPGALADYDDVRALQVWANNLWAYGINLMSRPRQWLHRLRWHLLFRFDPPTLEDRAVITQMSGILKNKYDISLGLDDWRLDTGSHTSPP